MTGSATVRARHLGTALHPQPAWRDRYASHGSKPHALAAYVRANTHRCMPPFLRPWLRSDEHAPLKLVPTHWHSVRRPKTLRGSELQKTAGYGVLAAICHCRTDPEWFLGADFKSVGV